MVLFITLYKAVLPFEPVGEILKCDHSYERYRDMYFTVVLLIMLYKVVLPFESVDEILKCDHSNESYRAVRSCGSLFGCTRRFLLLSMWTKF